VHRLARALAGVTATAVGGVLSFSVMVVCRFSELLIPVPEPDAAGDN
jgi:hypothetical protein